MARRSAFKGIANDVISSFVSRNNDVDGYWGIGMLHSSARENSTSKVRVELANESSPVPPALASLIERYRLMIEEQAADKGLRFQACSIEVEFDLPRNSSGLDFCRGDENAFRCSLTIVDDRGRAWNHMVSGCSHPHDPVRESRSSRAS